MKYNFIERYSDFILNETLTSHNIDLTISNVEEELSLMRYDFSIKKLYRIKIKIYGLRR